jgi:hypothetical protein
MGECRRGMGTGKGGWRGSEELVKRERGGRDVPWKTPNGGEGCRLTDRDGRRRRNSGGDGSEEGDAHDVLGVMYSVILLHI